ncbi:MAG: NADH dehydrogenase subunit F [Candidatus Scalindua rubra]|uniref:NADH dehydrogenase subunit F n=1 Tax=Candidatus Scalindua rubra TaxID=1872076 RepID=A0A1E3XF14_9BACT|nr:MAG: NADH dehydrogenase subunit F [Candidatus Scalindua rubra]
MIGLLLLIPLITATLCYFAKNRRDIEYINLIGAAVLAIASIFPIAASLSAPIYFFRDMFFMDAFSSYFMSILIFISFVAAMYSIDYMGHEFKEGVIDIKELRYFYALLHLFIFTMVLATVSNNIAIFWMAIEGTTLVTSMLVGFYKDKESVEAAWKYIILCTVGITFGLLGIFIVYYASASALGGDGTLNWTELRDIAHDMNPKTLQLAFILIIVGYGAKAGFAPIHNWLPDAHSQAPSPISALLSGVLIKCALLGIVRFVIIGNASLDTTFYNHLLLIFGLVSMGIATAFILLQNNYKRLLAYSSIEHIGIIAIGVGIGSFWGIYGALLHMLNHAIVKTLLFFTTGRVRLKYHSTVIGKVKGAIVLLPISGTVMLLGALAIAGCPPFNIFLSEYTILKAAVDKGNWVTFSLFIVFATIIFGGILHHFGSMAFGAPSTDSEKEKKNENKMSLFPIIILVVTMLVLGIYIPGFLDGMLNSSVKIITGN